MLRSRRVAALLALLVTAWSGSTVLPCGTPVWGVTRPTGVGQARAAGAEHHHHGRPGGHGGAAHDDGHGHDASQSDEGGRDCGLMACALGLRVVSDAAVPASLPPQLDDAPFGAVPAPSAVDLTQDPPPPRRHA
ncbi:MAG: hypothetical protein AB7T31_02115 [Gemmatimonadales bacterium]